MKKVLVLFVLIFSSVLAFSQTSELKGSVVDANTGETLLGATITINGETTIAISDFDGNFVNTQLPEGEYTIQCSYVSYKTEEIKMVINKGVNEIDFKLVSALPECSTIAKLSQKCEDKAHN